MTSLLNKQSVYAYKSLLLLLVLFVSTTMGCAQRGDPACPPAPVQPTADKVQELVQAAKDRGFLWKITKNGSSGYLYGSMHVGRLEWAIPGPKTLDAIHASKVIALELDILDPRIQAQMSDPSQFGIPHVVLPPTLQQRMDAVARKVCAPAAAFAGLHPVMQLATVSILDARFASLEVSYGSEVFLSSFAKGSNRTLVSLESAELQMRALMGGEAKEIVESVDSGLTLLENGRLRQQTERMINAWATGNLAELQQYEQWCECTQTEADRKLLQRINGDRNPLLAANIDRLMRERKNVFVAIGSLHMAGPKAVTSLLEDMGYKVERVAFDK
jgi:uncharacterized protein YbaP (TraB family)